MSSELSKHPMDQTQFLTALMAIVVIDLVLAGDNAIVIALAARGLPAHLRRRAILWGAVGAIAVRSLLTVAVVWLLKVPGLLLVGGALLVWIAWRLLQPEAQEGGHASAATTFWGAMRTIVVADAIMGLDNVLAVAGAAHGSYLLVVAGLVISVPIVVWGSTLVLRVVERYRSVVYLGAGVLVWTAVKMMTSEPLLGPWLALWPAAGSLIFIAVPLLLWAAFVRNHRRLESRIHARLADFAQRRPAAASDELQPEGERNMLNVLVPVDGSPNSLNALRHAISEYRLNHELQLQLLNVQPPLMRHAARFISGHDRAAYHRDKAELALAPARKLLDGAGVPYRTHCRVGGLAAEVCAAAQSLHCHHIVMGTARKNSLTRMLQDSATHQVLETATVPVEVVAGKAVSKLESWGLPVGVGAGLAGLAWMVVD